VTSEPDVAEAARNLSHSLAQLAETTKDYVRTQVGRADGAMHAESRRRLWLVLSAGAMLVALCIGALFAGAAIVIAWWDSHRVLSTALVAIGYLVLAGAAALVFHYQWRRRPSVMDWLAQIPALIGAIRQLHR
jgi:uncharacterized membrane protein YqjE